MYATEKELQGKRSLVMGGTQGIRAAIVKRLTEGSVPDMLVLADVGTPENVAQLAEEARRQLGVVDILVNTVGGSSSPPGGMLATLDDPIPTV